MVALQDRLVEAEDAQLSPAVQPGAQLSMLPAQAGNASVPSSVVLANEAMGWCVGVGGGGGVWVCG